MPIRVGFVVVQENPKIYVTAIPGKWLFLHSTPSTRIENPKKGFQRKIGDKRSKKIAKTVLDKRRTVPNAIVVASEEGDFEKDQGQLVLPDRVRFLVVDGQHRLFAADKSTFPATYPVVMHMGLSKEEMARLFLEINDKQKKVPPSLRWDLYRLVKPEEDAYKGVAAEMVYELNRREGSALLDRIDLTGERTDRILRQASIAPQIRSLLSSRKLPLRGKGFEAQYSAIDTYLAAIRSLDPDRWDEGESVYFQPKVLRVLLRVFGDILLDDGRPIGQATAPEYARYIEKIDVDGITPEVLKKVGGSSGVRAIYESIKGQILA